MRKWVMALLAVLALSVGVAWGEGNHSDKTHSSSDGGGCCCCAKSCPK